jgi:hypothetical protein
MCGEEAEVRRTGSRREDLGGCELLVGSRWWRLFWQRRYWMGVVWMYV